MICWLSSPPLPPNPPFFFFFCVSLVFSFVFIHNKHVTTGNVEFVVGEKRTIVKDFSTFSEKEGVFILKDKNAQLFIRIGFIVDFHYGSIAWNLHEIPFHSSTQL